MDSKISRVTQITIILLLTAGCASTPTGRIENHQQLFNTYPPDVQAKIRSQQVDIGFTEDMVLMAFGNPTETSVRVDEDGSTLTWGYLRSMPSFSVGVGAGTGIGAFDIGSGVDMETGGGEAYAKIVEFQEGRVVTTEYFD